MEKKPNQCPYNNDVIEKQYEELKNGIKFRIENNITDDWEQHYHCIDGLCENHKARIRDIENSISKIEQLEQQLTESEKKVEELKGERLKFYTDDVRRTQVINGVHFDIEHLLVFSEYVEHENWVKANKDKEIDKLKQELAEKEKELQYKTAECEKWKADYKNCSELEKIMTKEHQYCLDNWRASEQDKISFAVEQLEKVKKELTKYYGEEIAGYVVDKIIDNQIKEIKGE